MNDESRLEQLAKRLGARAAERLDVPATAQKILARLREEPVRRTVRLHATWLRIAALLVIVVGGAAALRGALFNESGDHVAHFIADDLADLSAAELRDVLAAFDDIVAEAVEDSSADLHELDTQQLRTMLRSPEG